MEFLPITPTTTIAPGEYLLHIPSKQVVLVGAYKAEEGKIKALANGKLMEDVLANFQKIKLNKKERKKSARPRCGGCKK
tara:strand:- start:6801 stop:7037 length:237 start_codon:yes stop_codon:yes gene_type:complete